MKHQQIAFLDLETERANIETVPEEWRRRLLGGRGINMALLYLHATAQLSSLDPAAPLIIGAGLLSGLPCPSASRCSISGKSPETGLLGDSNMGGFFSAELRKTGFDHLVIHGRATQSTYLFVENGRVSFRGAMHLWGMDTLETMNRLRQTHGKGCQVICIGPAGENLVRFACVRHGLKSAAGRGGLGCLMGAKNLKAIVVKGNRGPIPADKTLLKQYSRELNKRLLASKASQALHKYGTPFLFDLHNHRGIVRTFNGRESQFLAGRALRASWFKDHYRSSSGCYGCVIACRHQYERENRFGQKSKAEGPEYGTLAAFGPICGIGDPQVILDLNDRVNRYGLDSVTTGNMIAWAIELYQEGVITTRETRGLQLNWGDSEVISALVDQIAFREGIGNILADGPKQALRIFGPQAEHSLVWGKGLIQSDSVDVRSHKGFALGVATATRGADHLRSRPTLEALSLTEDALKAIYGGFVANDPKSYRGKALMVWRSELEFALADALGICRFAQRFNSVEHLSPEELKSLVHYATGYDMPLEEFLTIGERITTLERMFLVREGIRRKDDTLPARYFEPVPAGRCQGERIDPLELDRMLDEYYDYHGWARDTGIPEIRTLEALHLDFTMTPERDIK
jgi:aldehyde:ferredoxin oxidoreductase